MAWSARRNDAISVFIDTGVFVGARNSRDDRHRLSVEVIKKALKGAFGAVYTSDYVIDEAVTLALARTGKPEIAFDIGDFIFKSDRIRLLWTDRSVFASAWEMFRRHREKRLSFTDCISLAHIEDKKIKFILSFDAGFRGLAEYAETMLTGQQRNEH
ncbi:MAG: PIN domain-containing protein [Candidatus Thermoplasmatota archaeon]|nr:PIN domain-containing protein [Candidatus Thermoplasmatota archaeon]MCL5253090.1 PIN domain-containing protein [Candidatus Thermoplasmatota archaeon]